MRLIFTLCFYLLIGQGTANAAFIDYEFNTLTFSDGHQVTGGFTIEDTDNSLFALAISLFGPDFNIDFDINNLSAPEAFSVSFDNMIFGDTFDEGFSLQKDGVLLVTGEFGLGDQDTCYFDPETCTSSLFTFTSTSSTSSSVDAPQMVSLLSLSLLFMFRRNRFN